ncbi:hypothetical protein [Richelia sinica]|uniref:hypothetical protein n=1 Tax=Richelia sinica TaxID=1357545 RepID=UPI00198839CD|nr:hypothetical protein [Richelia sinica]MBD2666236.1 hypothetical protein [Richelia sinica FACHB-800]
MQQSTTVTESITILKPNFTAATEQNHQVIQQRTSNLSLDTNLDVGTIAILNQIETEHEYYQTCGRW